MGDRQLSSDSSQRIARNFEFTGEEYTGTWSAAHRYACEITELATLPSHECTEQIERIKAKRGATAAAQMTVDVQAKRQELIGSGVIKLDKPKSRPAGGYSNYRSSYGNNQARNASTTQSAHHSATPKRAPSSGGPF